MTDWTDRQIPPPTDWPAFERLCHRLWLRIWKDPNAQRNGRSGQPQHGVDVFGQPQGTNTWAGLQCKGTDARYGHALTEAELRAEVDKAKRFTPALTEYIVATTAENDASIQAVARELTDTHRRQGLFTVAVFGWSEIVQRLSEHCPEAIEELLHLPSGANHLPQIAEHMAALHEGSMPWQGAVQTQLSQILSALSTHTAVAPANAVAHARLDQIRDLLREREPQAALRLLDRLAQTESNPPTEILFRIHTNRGAAHLALGDFARAAAEFHTAFGLEPKSDKAAANRVLAFLLQERVEEAAQAGQAAIAAHPDSPLVLAALIHAESRRHEGPFAPEVPSALRESPDVLFALGHAAALHQDYAAAEDLLRRALAANPDDPIVQSRLAEVLLAAGTGGGHLYLGGVYTEADATRLREAGALFDRAWSLLRASEVAAANVRIVANRCATHLALGEVEAARSLVDDGLAVAPDESELLKLKIRLSLMRDETAAANSALSRLSTTDPEYPPLRAMTLRATEPMRGLMILESFIRSTTPEPPAGAPEADPLSEPNIVARCLYADLLCEADLAHAEARFAALPRAGTIEVVRSTLIFAQALHVAAGNGRPYLEQARSQLQETTEPRAQALLADTLYALGDTAEAAQLYRPLISPQFDSPSLRHSLSALLSLDQRQTFRALADQLTPEIRG